MVSLTDKHLFIFSPQWEVSQQLRVVLEICLLGERDGAAGLAEVQSIGWLSMATDSTFRGSDTSGLHGQLHSHAQTHTCKAGFL